MSRITVRQLKRLIKEAISEQLWRKIIIGLSVVEV